LADTKHVGFPLPSEMFHDSDIINNVDFVKHEAISELLEIPLKCPHCGEVLKKK
jgi:hypothetical protein